MDHDPKVILDLLGVENTSRVSVRFFDSLQRAIVLVDADVLPGEFRDTRKTSRHSGWDVDAMTVADLERLQQQALLEFPSIAGVTGNLAKSLVDLGYLSLDDLSVIEPAELARLGTLTNRQAEAIIEETDSRLWERRGDRN